MTKTEVDTYLAEMQTEFEATKAAVPTMRCGQTHRTGFGGVLTVTGVGFDEVSPQAVLDGTAPAQVVVLTEDGRRPILNDWHTSADGPESDDVVYCERWTAQGRVFHGYVDSVSRKVVQTG